MAFVQPRPRDLQATLRLHHTTLSGRRINVERSCGGGVEKKREKLGALRQKQEQQIAVQVERILGEFTERGEIGADELDDGVKALLTRRDGRVVEQALREYCEAKQERRERQERAGGQGGEACESTWQPEGYDAEADWSDELQNPSAFLTSIVCRLSEEASRRAGPTRTAAARVGRRRRPPRRQGRQRRRARSCRGLAALGGRRRRRRVLARARGSAPQTTAPG